MSTLYLFDGHTAPLANSRLLDVKASEVGAQTQIDGRFVVKAEEGLQLPNPTDLNTLLTDKYAATLALYPGFTDIDYDAMLDATGLDATTAPAGTVLGLGERGTNSLVNGSIETTMAVLGSTPSQALVLWEIFSINPSNPSTGRFERFYVEADPSDWTVAVSFDNGSNYTAVSHGVLAPIPPAIQGNQMIVQFTTAVQARFFGSWAVIY